MKATWIAFLLKKAPLIIVGENRDLMLTAALMLDQNIAALLDHICHYTLTLSGKCPDLSNSMLLVLTHAFR